MKRRGPRTLNGLILLGFGLVALPLLFGLPYGGYGADTWLWIVLLALVPQLVGHTGFNWAVRHLDPTKVATVTLLEPLGATLLALLLFAEVPSPLTLLGAAALLLGVLSTVRAGRREGRRVGEVAGPIASAEGEPGP